MALQQCVLVSVVLHGCALGVAAWHGVALQWCGVGCRGFAVVWQQALRGVAWCCVARGCGHCVLMRCMAWQQQGLRGVASQQDFDAAAGKAMAGRHSLLTKLPSCGLNLGSADSQTAPARAVNGALRGQALLVSAAFASSQ